MESSTSINLFCSHFRTFGRGERLAIRRALEVFLALYR